MFEVGNYHEMLALHRAILAAKFSESLNDPALPGSRFLANVANRLIEAICAEEIARGRPDQAQSWQEWRQLSPERLEWETLKAFVESAAKSANWSVWTIEEKQEYVGILASPFMLDPLHLDALIHGPSQIVSQ